MTAYEELLEFGGERIFDFLKNARLHESQFKYVFAWGIIYNISFHYRNSPLSYLAESYRLNHI